MNPLLLFVLMFRASLFSTSGTGNLPGLHDDLLRRGWADERQFGEALAVGQVSPGPSGLWVVSLGYLVDGLRGALLATVAISLPPLLVLALDRLYRRSALSEHPAMEGFVRGLSLAVVGTFLVVLVQILRGVNPDTGSALIVAGSLVLGQIRRLPVVGVLALAALAGMLLYGGE